jgi:DNA invertase Pin-like site-specific DNA recombinase
VVFALVHNQWLGGRISLLHNPRMKFGYARVSTQDQNPALQADALAAAGCDEIITDTVSGALLKRPKLDRLLDGLRAGDVLTVWRLDRLGRSLPHLIETVRLIEAKGAHLQSLTEGIDTTTAQGRLTFHLMAALAEFERALIVERTKAGLVAARKRGVRMGRPPRLSADQITHARKLVEAGERVRSVAYTLRVDAATLYRALKK